MIFTSLESYQVSIQLFCWTLRAPSLCHCSTLTQMNKGAVFFLQCLPGTGWFSCCQAIVKLYAGTQFNNNNNRYRYRQDTRCYYTDRMSLQYSLTSHFVFNWLHSTPKTPVKPVYWHRDAHIHIPSSQIIGRQVNQFQWRQCQIKMEPGVMGWQFCLLWGFTVLLSVWMKLHWFLLLPFT